MTSEFLKDRLQKVIELIELAEHDISGIESKPISPYSVLARALCYTVEQVCEHLIALKKYYWKFQMKYHGKMYMALELQ